MIAYIKGNLISAAQTYVIVEANGIGYQIFIPLSTNGRLPNEKSEIFFHISFVIRENSQSLYGFLTNQEKEIFEALMNITGIGPKLALAIVGHLSVQNLQEAIFQQDLSMLTKVPGIGKKTAERLILELKDKFASIFSHSPLDYAVSLPSDPKSLIIKDAMSALVNLGYNQIIAQKAIKKTLQEVTEEIDLPTLIRSSLKHL